MGRLKDFFDAGGVEIETAGDNPPDVATIAQASQQAPSQQATEASQSCSVSGGAAWTMVIK